MSRKSTVNRIARALGASRVVPLRPTDSTPFGMVALTNQVLKLRSTGPGGVGRPGDPRATVPRIVKFRPGTWRKLAEVANAEATKTGTRVSPAQVAAMLIDLSLDAANEGGHPKAAQRANQRERVSLLASIVAGRGGKMPKRLAKS